MSSSTSFLILLTCLSAACSSGGSGSPSRQGTGGAGALSIQDVNAGCERLCERHRGCNASLEQCQYWCVESLDFYGLKQSYFQELMECQSCGADEVSDVACFERARSVSDLTEAGREFCEAESILGGCLVQLGEGIDGCEEWTRQLADGALDLFVPCVGYPSCDDVMECIRATFAGDPFEPYDAENSCDRARDGYCDEPFDCIEGTDSYDCAHVDPKNRCRSANDGRCDGLDLCEPGTDTFDCEVADRQNRCVWARNGQCDEPGTCTPGTDTEDCDRSSPGERCEYAGDGVCDEPVRCLPGTDRTDCTPCDADAGADGGC